MQGLVGGWSQKRLDKAIDAYFKPGFVFRVIDSIGQQKRWIDIRVEQVYPHFVLFRTNSGMPYTFTKTECMTFRSNKSGEGRIMDDYVKQFAENVG